MTLWPADRTVQFIARSASSRFDHIRIPYDAFLLSWIVLKVVQVILDDSDGDSDSDLEIVEQLNRRKGKKAQNDEDPFFDLTVRVVREPAVRLSTPLEAEATLRMRNSLQQLKQMRSLLDAAESQQEGNAKQHLTS